MNIHKKTIIVILIYSNITIFAQSNISNNENNSKFSITGKVVFENEKENAIGVQVFLEDVFIGTTTDFSGNYKINNIKKGEYTLSTQYIGYKKFSQNINLDKNLIINITLQEAPVSLESIIVTSDRLIDRASVSDISITASEIESFKGLQEDPINTLTIMPGITKGNNDLFSSTQLYVRGGAPDENLFLYNNVKMYWPWYSGGIKSIFNNEVIKNLELLTGGFSAKYGNAMSSVMRITTREGKYDKFGGNFTFGFSGMQATAEGPFAKDKVSALLSVRKTYLDLILVKDAKFPITNIFDGTYKVAWKINRKHKLSLSGLSSREKLDFIAFEPQPGMPNEMNTYQISHNQSIQLQSIWNRKFYTNLSVYHSLMNSNFSIGNNMIMDLTGIETGLREDATYRLNRNHKINFGIEGSFHNFRNKGNIPLDPTTIDYNDTTVILREIDINSKSQQFGAYISYSGDVFKKLSITVGLRSDYLYFNNEFTNINYSPRLSLKYRVLSKTNIRTSYGYFYQFPDIEALGKNIKSNLSKHYIFGIEQNFSSHFRCWLEAYYKDYKDLVVYNTENDTSYQLFYSNLGSGYVKGIELFLMKKQGRLSGWISYAYSIAKRRQSLQDKEYFFEYDRPHMFSIASEYKISDKVSWYIPHLIIAQFRFESGNPYTPVISAVQTFSGWMPIKGEINSKRNPSFHNLTIKIVWLNKKTDKIQIKSFFEVWNVYNHKNLLNRIYQYGNEYENNLKINEYYSTPLMPSGGVRIQF